MPTFEPWSLTLSPLALAIPVTYACGALARSARPGPMAVMVSSLSAGLAVVWALLTSLAPETAVSTTLLGVEPGVVTRIMLVLVCSIGWVIVRYSRSYLAQDPLAGRAFRWLLLTLSAVTTLVLANNLLLVAVAWSATSLSLHQLLTYFNDRTAALVAAHKKFLVSRLADVCLWSSLGLVFANVGSLGFGRIAAWAVAHPELTPTMQVATVLLVLAVALKSAQLPFHGWLIQVMEAPTPVSALLHAGVVNIGGLVMIRLAPLMAHATLAQTLLVVIGLITTVTATLVATTRISVKVALAWSTCAQMGFMLVQCGLGAWHLALLHLVAHSLYKAHAFLSAGTTVETWRVRAMAQSTPSPRWPGLVLALGAAGLGVTGFMLWPTPAAMPAASDLVLVVLVGLSLAPLLAFRGVTSARALWWRLASVAVVLGLYAAWHRVAGVLGSQPVDATAEIRWVLVGVALTLLFALKTWVQHRPQSTLAVALYPWLFAGLYLDEWFTRMTFRLWPPHLPQATGRDMAPLKSALEASP